VHGDRGRRWWVTGGECPGPGGPRGFFLVADMGMGAPAESVTR
jgi:hypothetical protein